MKPILKKQLEEGVIAANLPRCKNKFERVRSDIKAMFKLAPDAYLSLSWGKQSIILAHMIYQIKPKALMVFWANEMSEVISDFSAVRDAFIDKWPINYVGHEDGDTELDVRGKELSLLRGGIFMGLAKDESKGRRITLNKCDKNNIYKYKDGTYRCCPLANWETIDYAAYIARHSIPLLRQYRDYGLTCRTSAGMQPDSHAWTGVVNLTNSARRIMKDKYGC